MAFLRKLNELKRVGLAEKLRIVGLLLKKKLVLPLTEVQRETLHFFDCLALVDGQVISKTHEQLTLSVAGIDRERLLIRLRENSSDRAVFKQILCWEEYEPVVTLFRQRFADRTDSPINIIDAGGNIGLSALYFRRCFATARIVCVEPDAGNFEQLAFNLKATTIATLQAAVWNRNCRIGLRNDFRDGQSWSLRAEELSEPGTSGIKAYSLDQIMEDQGMAQIDILKLDVEGAEKEIFAQRDLYFLRKTRCLAIEIHDEFGCRDMIYEQLREHGFAFTDMGSITVAFNKAYLVGQPGLRAALETA